MDAIVVGLGWPGSPEIELSAPQVVAAEFPALEGAFWCGILKWFLGMFLTEVINRGRNS